MSLLCVQDSATAGSTARALSPTDRLYETIAERFEEWNRRLVAGKPSDQFCIVQN